MLAMPGFSSNTVACYSRSSADSVRSVLSLCCSIDVNTQGKVGCCLGGLHPDISTHVFHCFPSLNGKH